MYCGACRLERLGNVRACIACGESLQERPREALERDLEHVRFVLAEVTTWDADEVNRRAREWLQARYERAERVLTTLLQPPAPVAAIEPPVSEVVAVLEVEASPPEIVADEPAAQPMVAEAEETVDAFEPPHVPTEAERAVEAVSKWKAVWRPFLYESIGWFIGGFLILAGAFYFIAESWTSAATRALIVFGVSAGYAAGFTAWGAFLRRREAFLGAGRVIGVIGAAVSPLPALALGPLLTTNPPLFWTAAGGWAVCSAWMLRPILRSLTASLERPLQASMFITTLVLAAAPQVARLGSGAVWLNLLPLAALWYASRTAGFGVRYGPAYAFAALAPLYLSVLFSARMHLALAAADALPALGTYAPILSIAVAAALDLRGRTTRAASPLELAAVAVQLACAVGAAFGANPSFFVAALALAHTSWRLSVTDGAADAVRARWLYVTYFAAHFAYQTVGQLVPGVVKALVDDVKAALGYTAADPFPFNFGAVYVLPFAFGVVALLAWQRRRDDARAQHVREVLLRSTAVLAVLAMGIAFSGPDMRAGWWSAPVLAAITLALGVWFDRAYLTGTAAGLSVLVPIFGAGVLGLDAGAGVTATSALILAVTSVPLWRAHRAYASAGTFLLASIAVGFAMLSPSMGAAVAVSLAGAAALLVARNLDERWLTSFAIAVLASAAPLWTSVVAPAHIDVVIAATAVVLSAVSLRGGRMQASLPVAVLCAVAAPLMGAPTLDPVVLVLVAAAFLVGGYKEKWLQPLAAAALFALFLPGAVDFAPLQALPTQAALLLYGAMALVGAVLATVRRWRPASLSFGIAALVGAAVFGVLGFDAPMALIASIVALVATRAVHPAITLPVATILAAGAAATSGPLSVVAVVVVLTVIAVADEWPRLRALLLGAHRVAWPAAVCAATASLGACAAGYGVVTLPASAIILLALLPFAWMRAARTWVFALLPPLFAAIGAAEGELLLPVLLALPAAVLVATRLIGWEVVSRVLLKDRAAHAATANAALLVGFVAVGVVALMTRPDWAYLAPLWAAALFFARAPLFPVRVLVACAFALALPAAGPAWVLALIAFAFFRHHAPTLARRLAGSDEDVEVELPAIAAMGLASLFAVFPTPSAEGAWLLAGALAVGAWLVRQRWLLVPTIIVAAAVPLTGGVEAVWSHGFQLHAAIVALLAAAGAVLFRLERVRETTAALLSRIAPSDDGDWHAPLWLGAAMSGAAAIATCGLSGGAAAPIAAPVAAAALLLLWTRSTEAAVAAGLLLALTAVVGAPEAWRGPVVAAVGLALCASGLWKDDAARGRHHLGWALAVAALVFSPGLSHPATPVATAFAVCALWIVARRTPTATPWAWVATLLGAHVALFYAGLALDTGKPKELILPYVGAASALLGAVALGRVKRVAMGFCALAAAEIAAGLVLVEGPSPREAAVALGALAVLVFALVRRALREDDALAAWGAFGMVALGYLTFRAHGMNAPMGTGDAVAALVCGAALAGLQAWAQRTSNGLSAFRGPVLAGIFAAPLLGLVAAPWASPGACSVLLLAVAVHFSVAVRAEPLQKVARVFSFVAFNAALVLAWVGTQAVEPQYLLIPASLALLLLVRTFEDDLSPLSAARLRAFAITAIYAAAAFRPLMFDHGWAMVFCVFVCLVGVAAGVAFRIRSYVYLGTAFMVAAVLANLVRFGVRDHRLGALFLSVLGLLVVGFMVLLSARRAELLKRYADLRKSLQHWQG